MVRKIKFFIIFLSVSLVAYGFWYEKGISKAEVCFKNVCYQAEIVDTPFARSKGLMYRETLPEGKAMLFIFFEDGLHGFWMKNMKFALDIIWIDRENRIVDIKENALPCFEKCPVYSPRKESRYVLEVNAGEVKKNNLTIGDEVTIKITH